MIFDLMDHKTSTITIMLIATTVACHIVTSIEDFGTLSSCFLFCSYYDLLNSCVKVSEHSCSKETPDILCCQIPVILPFFVNCFNFQVISVDQASLSLWTYEQEMFLQSWVCQPHAPTPNLEDQGLFF